MPFSYSVRVLLIVILFGFGLSLSAQNNSYQQFRKEGLRLSQLGDYNGALQQFNLALESDDLPQDHDLIDQIQLARKNQIRHYENLIALTKKEAEEARIAREAEAVARAAAEVNEIKAIKSGKQAESLLLALRADIARQEGLYAEALYLAYTAFQISDSTTINSARKAFANVVRDSFGTVIPTRGLIQKVDCYRNLDAWLSFVDETGLNFFDMLNYQVKQTDANQGHLLASYQDKAITGSWKDNNGTLHNLKNDFEQNLSNHKERITTAVFASDGTFFVTGSRDNQGIIWDQSGNFKNSLEGHRGNIYQILITSDNQHIITRSSDGTVKIWLTNGQLKASLGKEEGYIRDIQLLEEGTLLITRSDKGHAKIWDLAGQFQFTLEHGNDGVKQLVCRKGKVLTMASDHQLKVWDTSGNLLSTLNHPTNLNGAAFYGQEHLLTWAADRTIRLWSIDGSTRKEFIGHQGPISGLSIASSAKLILSTGEDGSTKLWDLAGNLLTEWELNTTEPIPGIISEEMNQILVVDKGNQRLSLFPFPDQILQGLLDNKRQYDLENQHLRKKYNIQFWQ